MHGAWAMVVAAWVAAAWVEPALAAGEPVAPALVAPPSRVGVGPGVYRPTYAATPAEAEVPVARFLLAATPVTNADFAFFLTRAPKWRRDRIDPIFADEGYLGDWAAADAPGATVEPTAPVTRVSWFAARAYCAASGGRLPTEPEWELAAAASETSFDARQDPAFVQRLLAWYGEPTPARFPPVGGRAANRWGVRDLHGLVWEWVEDFNASLMSVDARDDNSGDDLRFCGAGAASATDPGDYASFMRVALRTSLEARATVRTLGFRCAWSAP
ncbi:MAG: formylglycine-generating enzyme family protein [Pseudomonadota bacterium]|nr:formylglycine-generating enzyme family protein [Pseudomonadota bacterium]